MSEVSDNRVALLPVDHEPDFDHSLVPVEHDPFAVDMWANQDTTTQRIGPTDRGVSDHGLRGADATEDRSVNRNINRDAFHQMSRGVSEVGSGRVLAGAGDLALGAAKNAFSPALSYPETYRRMNQEARDQISRGFEQSAAHDGAWNTLIGAGNVLFGTLGYVGSPLSAAYRSVMGQPVEDVTGIPREYTEFAGQLATPGLGLRRVTMPAVRSPKMAGSAAETESALASKSASIYDPPVKPPRPFEADYPNGAMVDAEGRLTKDIDGNPLVARYIAGRTTLPNRNVAGAMGGDDQAIPATELNAIAKGLFGKIVETWPSSAFPRGSVGSFTYARGANGPERIAKILNTLAPEDAARVSAHEIAHGIENLAGEIPTDGVVNQLRRVYNDVNTHPEDFRMLQQERTGVPVARRYQVTPEDFGYKKSDVAREYWAEAIRAHMSDANYIKTVAPDVAARIRKFFNSNPRINKIIQFNSLAAGAGLGAGSIGDETGEPNER